MFITDCTRLIIVIVIIIVVVVGFSEHSFTSTKLKVRHCTLVLYVNRAQCLGSLLLEFYSTDSFVTVHWW